MWKAVTFYLNNVKKTYVKQPLSHEGFTALLKKILKGLVKKELIFFLIRIPSHAHQDKEKSCPQNIKNAILFVESIWNIQFVMFPLNLITFYFSRWHIIGSLVHLMKKISD
ncbi:hypothetical protein COK01_28130 [Priestia megaterium]|uniref:Uncharacterized protein n=1 Tax=Priestia megaterium TaxID=1404 RepID=A0AAE5UB44_PRIMG|nr:hypothetical protein CON45_28360 [Priestia megaterium]RFB21822.1 hypothetical protein DZB87_24055 [Bacillus sp. ALD]RFB34381.1 hypothetical protein DZB86_24705 [Bacillus sp. RC]PEE42197.1 hypothetical protein COM71_30255 [Priestia megaterium]PER65851.1 hypothetical protein CN492_27505 [Priestia megaterium]